MKIILICISIFYIFSQIHEIGSTCSGYCREKEDCEESGEGKCDNNLTCCKAKNLKSKEKCREYGKYVYTQQYAPSLLARSMKQNATECEIEAVPLIVGGTFAKEKEFPHMVAIGFGEDLKTASWMCGGSLISEKFVLSAAHCAKSREKGPAKYARTGMLSLNETDESRVQDFTISEIIVHPKYKPPSRYYDISLFKLSDLVQFNGHVRPACISTSSDEFKFQRISATGWGKLNYSDDSNSPDLMKVSIGLIDYSTCKKFYKSDEEGKSLARGVISSQLCAGELKGGKDTCQGDSGGPLQIVLDDPYCMYSIIGITSFGKFCGFKNSPAIYTRVSYFIPWIESIVWP